MLQLASRICSPKFKQILCQHTHPSYSSYSSHMSLNPARQNSNPPPKAIYRPNRHGPLSAPTLVKEKDGEALLKTSENPLRLACADQPRSAR